MSINKELAKKLADHPEIYFKTNKLGELYFRFIKGTPLQANGWTGELLAKQLEAWGFIKITIIQPQDEFGRFLKGQKVYYDLPGKRISRIELVKLLLAKKPKPDLGFFQRLFQKESV